MKAKLLISFYRSEGGHKVHRVYLEQHFEQAEKDLEMIQDADSLGKDWELQECEVYNTGDIEINNNAKTINNTKIIKSICDIDTTTEEGKMLIAGIAKISTESQKDKTPEKIIEQLQELKDKMYY